jgi:hypothetical protein
MRHSAAVFVFAAALAFARSAAVVPGKVVPNWPQSWDLKRSIAMICNASGRVDPAWGAQWGLLDLDWNGDKPAWSKTRPMTVEEDMVENMADVKKNQPADEDVGL